MHPRWTACKKVVEAGLPKQESMYRTQSSLRRVLSCINKTGSAESSYWDSAGAGVNVTLDRSKAICHRLALWRVPCSIVVEVVGSDWDKDIFHDWIRRDLSLRRYKWCWS
jgi:hypothetical protein